MNSHTSEPSTRPTARLDPFRAGFGLTLVGMGLLSLAVVDASRMVLEEYRRTQSTATHADFASDNERLISDEAAPILGTNSPMLVAVEPDALQSAVGTGPGSPVITKRVTPPATGQLVGLAANPIPNGTAIYRLWSSGRVEAMISTETATWGDWMVVAPGKSTDMRRPQAPEDPDDPR